MPDHENVVGTRVWAAGPHARTARKVLRGEPPGAILPVMSTRTHRLDHRRLLPLVLLLGLACEDSPTTSSRYIAIVEPLRMQWPDRDHGVPYDGGTAVFEASSALRVVWSFRIEGFTTDGRAPLYKQTFENQDRIAFTWNGQGNFGSDAFGAGDSCVASVTYKQLDPAQTDLARVVFKIGP